MKKNGALEGLRGIAAIAVILSHCVFTFFPYLQNCIPSFIKQSWESVAINFPRTFFNGTFAVCIFFVMSGFVLSTAFFQGRADALANAALKRYLRLVLPVAASILVCCALMSAGALRLTVTDLPGFIGQAYQGRPDYAEAAKDALWRALVNGAQSYNYVLWTIRIEFFGSMLLFAFLALFGKARYAGIYALMIVALIATFDPLNAPLYGLFFVGAYLNNIGDIGRSRISHALALILGLFLGGAQWCTPAYGFLAVLVRHASAFVPAELLGYLPYGAGAVLVVWVAIGDNGVARMLSATPLRWLGHLSFSIYLLHSFVLSSIGMQVYAATAGLPLPVRALLSTLCVILASITAAVPFARLVDDQAVRLANRFAAFSLKPSSMRR